MRFLKIYEKNIIKYDLLNKFKYKEISKLPQIKKIVLNFTYKNSNIKNLITSLIALELIANQKGLLTYSNISNISLKIRKGQPIGCKVIIKKKYIYLFFSKLVIDILPNFKNFKEIKMKKVSKLSSITLKIKSVLGFLEFEGQYKFLKDLSSLNITIVTDLVTYKEFFFLLKSFKIPVFTK
jgi:large subunit ribosomal protein L5